MPGYRGRQWMSMDDGAMSESGKVMPLVQMRLCCRFVPAHSKESTDASPVQSATECCCGYKYIEHKLSAQDIKAGTSEFPQGNVGEKWSVQTHTKTAPTNAYGDLEFVAYDDTGRKYVRLDVNTDMSLVKSILFKDFGLQEPTMLVSVTGGAKAFKMNKAKKACFKHGLMNVLKGCGAWLVTGGTHHGAMKDVGETIYDYRLMSASHQGVVAVGIATWGCIQDKELLINRKTESIDYLPTVRYRIYGEERKCEAFLDPHHTHYLLVDDGTQHKYGVEIPFRAKLEQAISCSTMLTSSFRCQESMSVPVVQLVLEGGPRTLYTVSETLENGIPVVVVKDSGRISDVLYHVYKATSDKNEFTEDLKKSAETMLRTFLNRDKDVLECLTLLEKCLEHRDLITDCELVDESAGIDVPILHALMKSKKNNVFEQLSLTLAWNRVDVAKSEVFGQKKYIQLSNLNNIMLLALKEGMADFVELLIDNGLVIESFMENNRLEELFSFDMCAGNHMLVRMLRQVKKKFGSKEKKASIFDIRRLLQSLIDLGIVTKGKLKKTDKAVVVIDSSSTKAYLSLFIWSILMNYQDLAKLFWIRGENPIPTALLGYGLLRAIGKQAFDLEYKNRLLSYANEFTNLAVGVMNECYQADERRTHLLLIRELQDFENVTCVKLAFDMLNRVFISHRAVQYLLNRIWFGNIAYDNSTLSLVIAPILPGLLILRYKGKITPVLQETEQNHHEMINSSASTGVMPSLTDTANEPMLKYSKSGKIHIVERSASQTEEEKRSCWQSCKTFCLFQRVTDFYTAPIMVFAHNMISYLLFLLLFSYMLLIEFRKELSYVEISLYIWVFTLMIEEFAQLKTGRNVQVHHLERWTFSLLWYRHIKPSVKYYLDSAWNRIDVLTIVLFICAVILRFLPYDETVEAARIVYGVTLLVFFFRLLRIFSVNQEMGPKLEMIKRMMIDLTYFIVILMVFVVSYAITAYSILYPNSVLDGDLFVKVMRLGYWNIYGELFLEELEIEEPDCSFDPAIYKNGTLPRCPEKHQQIFTTTLMGMYILISNVLLLNILIAMFGNTFQKVQSDTNLYWYYQRYGLIREFYERSILPPPLSIFVHVINVIKWICRKCCCRKATLEADTALNKRLTEAQDKQLSQWEAIMAEVYMYNKASEERNSSDNRVISLSERMDEMDAKIDELSQTQNQMKKPIERLEEKMDEILRLLKQTKK